MRLGGRGAVGRFALTSILVLFAAVAVVPTGKAAVGEVKIAVAAFVHGVRLLRLKVVCGWPEAARPLTEAPGGSCRALRPLILMGMAP